MSMYMCIYIHRIDHDKNLSINYADRPSNIRHFTEALTAHRLRARICPRMGDLMGGIKL